MTEKKAEKEKDRAIDIQCPVCGFYCFGIGGHGCIDKPKLVEIEEDEEEKEERKDEHDPEFFIVWILLLIFSFIMLLALWRS